MTRSKDPPRSGWRRPGLALQLMAAMGLVLLPLAVLGYSQTLQTQRVADARVRAGILGDTTVAATPQIEMILRGSGMAAGLASAMPGLIDDPARCIQTLADARAQGDGVYSFITYWRLDGMINCASDGESYDFSDQPFLQKWLEAGTPVVDVNPAGPVSGTAIVVFAHPVHDVAGQVTGFVTLSAPHAGFVEGEAAGTGAGAPLALVTFDAEGLVLTSSLGLENVDAVLPVDRPLRGFIGKTGQSFIASTKGGRDRAFAVVPLVPGKLYLLGSWPSERLEVMSANRNLPAFLFPALMWAASLLVAWIASEWLFLRHVRSLRDSITVFARGERKVMPLRFDHAAQELRDVGDAYETMTAAVLHDEADLENTIHQKEVLLREVHHRVKNNLQLIASILNMQVRSARAPETRAAMRNVQERVVSLATIHRELYQTSGLTDVRADELLPQIVAQILAIGSAPDRRFEVTKTIDPIRLTPDQAVPLALFVTEALVNVMKHGTPTQGDTVAVNLRLEQVAGDMARFVLTNAAQGPSDAGGPASDGFGSQLLRAFSMQLEGAFETTQAGGCFTLSLSFPLRLLRDAEERAQPRSDA